MPVYLLTSSPILIEYTNIISNNILPHPTSPQWNGEQAASPLCNTLWRSCALLRSFALPIYASLLNVIFKCWQVLCNVQGDN